MLKSAQLNDSFNLVSEATFGISWILAAIRETAQHQTFKVWFLYNITSRFMYYVILVAIVPENWASFRSGPLQISKETITLNILHPHF